MATSTRASTYRMPSYIQMGNGIILKGKLPGKTQLYLCFDASGSMGFVIDTFKEIIKNAIPQALTTPTEWFTDTYGKGTFKDLLPVEADSGFSDDGDRVIELCLEAEKKGYSPIGVTDGGGGIYKPENLKQLKRTILVGNDEDWLKDAKEINPNIQTLCIK